MKHTNDILIQHNLNILLTDKDLRKRELRDLNNNKLDKANCLVLLNELETNGLIILDNMNRLILTTKATTILNSGGWIIHSEAEKVKTKQSENTKSAIEILTLKKLKFEQFPAKFWWLIIIIMAFVSILTTWVNNQISKSENQQEPTKTEILLQK